MEHNDPLDYAPGTELHRFIMSTLGGHGGRLERERVMYVKRRKKTEARAIFLNA